MPVIREHSYLGLCVDVDSMVHQYPGRRPLTADEQTLMQRGKASLQIND